MGRGVSAALAHRYGPPADYMGGGTENIVLEVYAIEGNGSRASHNGPGYSDSDKSYTLNTVEHHAVAQVSNGGVQWRLT